MAEQKFYQLTPEQRRAQLNFDDPAIPVTTQPTSQLIENYLGDFALPLGVVPNLIVDGRSFVVPMVTEEPSVVAAANNGAKHLNAGGGVQTNVTQRDMIGQLLFEGASAQALEAFIVSRETQLFARAKAAHPSIVARGGGLKSLHVRSVSDTQTSVDFVVNTQDAMGANIVNTIGEALAIEFEVFSEQLLGVILSNYATESLTTARVSVPFAVLGGREVAQQIAALSRFAANDVYRATTENKGVFNGLAAVVLATGNDWRAVEAAGHAYAGRDGQYRALTRWWLADDQLQGELTLPLALGTVGGSISALPQAKASLALLGEPDAPTLRSVVAAIGLAQNLAALKAIANGGIQRGHMRMQYRALALQIGATSAEVDAVVTRLQTHTVVNEAVAREILAEIRK